MPRSYVRKKPPLPYNHHDLEQAVFDVMNRNKTYREAQEAYRVPISVIYHRIKGRKTHIHRMGAGRLPELPEEVEKCLVNCLIARAQMGFPCDKEELKDLVKEYILSNGIQSRFSDGRPGEDWYLAFMKRNPAITLKKPEHLQKARKKARDPFVIYQFFETVKKVYLSSQIDEKCGRLIFNADESGFANDPSRLRAIGEKGKTLQRVSDGSGRDLTTVLACASASGDTLPPLIVFKGAAVQPRWTSEEAYPGTMYATTSNGWMEESVFFNWFQKMFVAAVNKVREDEEYAGKTAILFYDGHASHISLRIVQMAISADIQLIKFPSHLTDRLQPIDKCVFGPVKTAWERVLVEHGKTKMGKGPSRLQKCEFVKLLGTVWTKMNRQNAVNGFLTTGLFPLDETKIPDDLFDPQDLARYRQRRTTIDKIIANSHSVSENDGEDGYPNLIDMVEDDGFFRAEIIPAIDEDSNAALDLSLPLRESSHEDEQAPSSSHTVNDMVSIFSKSISRTTMATKSPVKAAARTRLKHQTYGEVLTTDEVMLRLKEAEDKKANKVPKRQKNKEFDKKSEKPKKPKEPTTKGADSESEEELEPNILGTDEEDMDWDSYMQTMEEEQLEEVNYIEPQRLNILPNAFVLVEIMGGKRCKTKFQYLCRVDEILNDLQVTGLRSINAAKSKFKMVENDQFSVGWDQVKAILPTPQIEKDGRREIYSFSGTINVTEM